jgi:hypothetical protein
MSMAVHARDISLNSIMSQVGDEMTAIFPLIYTEREFSSSESEELATRLEHMSSLFVEAGPHIKQRSMTYEVSYEFINAYLAEIILALKTDRLDYARSRLYGISAICTSCHTQDTHLRTMFRGTQRQSFDSNYTYAEFNYLTRNYSEAEVYFDKYLRSKTHKTEFQIIRPLLRLITIYTQIYNRPGDGAKRLKQYLDLPDHTPETRAALKGWIKGLQVLQRSGVTQVKQANFQLLEHYVKQFLGNLDKPLEELNLPEDQQMSRVWLRGQLYHYLNRQPKAEEIPKILYWLSICDRSIGFNFYFSLGDMYLKDCVENYSSHPYAKKCYADYKTFITSAYSGAGGTFLPENVKKELQQMEAKLEAQETSPR